MTTMGWNDAVIEQFLRGEPRIADTFDRDPVVALQPQRNT